MQRKRRLEENFKEVFIPFLQVSESNDFSNLNLNYSNLLHLRNPQEQVLFQKYEFTLVSIFVDPNVYKHECSHCEEKR